MASAPELIGTVAGWDMAEVAACAYQPGRYSVPVYTLGDSYWCAPPKGKKPPTDPDNPERWNWQAVETIDGRTVYRDEPCSPPPSEKSDERHAQGLDTPTETPQDHTHAIPDTTTESEPPTEPPALGNPRTIHPRKKPTKENTMNAALSTFPAFGVLDTPTAFYAACVAQTGTTAALSPTKPTITKRKDKDGNPVEIRGEKDTDTVLLATSKDGVALIALFKTPQEKEKDGRTVNGYSHFIRTVNLAGGYTDSDLIEAGPKAKEAYAKHVETLNTSGMVLEAKRSQRDALAAYIAAEQERVAGLIEAIDAELEAA